MRQTIETVTCNQCGKRHEIHPLAYASSSFLIQLTYYDSHRRGMAVDFCDFECCLAFIKNSLESKNPPLQRHVDLSKPIADQVPLDDILHPQESADNAAPPLPSGVPPSALATEDILHPSPSLFGISIRDGITGMF